MYERVSVYERVTVGVLTFPVQQKKMMSTRGRATVRTYTTHSQGLSSAAVIIWVARPGWRTTGRLAHATHYMLHTTCYSLHATRYTPHAKHYTLHSTR